MSDVLPETIWIKGYPNTGCAAPYQMSPHDTAYVRSDRLTTARQCIMDLAAALHKMCEHNSPGIVYGQDALVHHAKTIEGCK